MIVGFPGGTDAIAQSRRHVSFYAATVLVENKPGAAARIAGREYVKNAEPDGSVMLFTLDFPVQAQLSLAETAAGFHRGLAEAGTMRYLQSAAQPAAKNLSSLNSCTCKANPQVTAPRRGTTHFVGMTLADAAGIP